MKDEYVVKQVKQVKHINFGIHGICSYTIQKEYDHEGRLPDTIVDLGNINFCISAETENEFHNDLKKLIQKHFI